MTAKLSAAMEDYLKAIFLLADEGAVPTTQALADRLGVAAPSVTSMIKRLHELGLVIHSPYREVELTPTGRMAAIEVVRHHRLIELYLSEFLDMPWEQVHDEAERLEHVISEDLESRMAAKLGQPSVDPHGHPIPTLEGAMNELPTCALWDVPPGATITITQVSDRDPGLLTYLAGLGLLPGTAVQIMAVSTYSGTQTLQVDESVHIIGAELARSIRVQPVGAEALSGDSAR